MRKKKPCKKQHNHVQTLLTTMEFTDETNNKATGENEKEQKNEKRERRRRREEGEEERERQ